MKKRRTVARPAVTSKRGNRDRASGFSLAECLIALSLALFVVCASLQFFGAAENHFFRLKDKEEVGQDAMAALDKMRIDILRAGQGLAGAMSLGLLTAVAKTEDGLEVVRAEGLYALAANVAPGSQSIPLTRTADLKAGREICIGDGEKAELRTLSSVESGAAVLSLPLDFGYAQADTTVALIERVRLVFDPAQGTLKRKVNSSPAQPLLEEARLVDFQYDGQENLARIRLSVDGQGENTYELFIFPKNPALAGTG